MTNNTLFDNIIKDSDKNSEKKLSDKEIDEIFNSDIAKEFSITRDDVVNNPFLISSIINEIDRCRTSSSEDCILEIGYHRYIEKNGENLNIYVKKCDKREKVNNKYSYKNNFIYDSYNHQEISKVLVSEKYFRDKVHISVKNIVSLYNEMINTKNIKSLYIYGDFGIGKTYISMAIANGIAKYLNKKVIFIYTSELVSMIKEGFNDSAKNIKVNNLIEDIKSVDVLFFDDIGAEYANEWFYNEYLLSILNERLNAKKPTFFNSNFSLNNLQKNLELKIKNTEQSHIIVGRIMDRIRSFVENKEIEMIGKNRRY